MTHYKSLLSACAVVAALFAPSVSQAAGAPKIVFDEYEWNFGDMYQQEEQSHVFAFTNAGDAPLVVKRTHTACGCTAAIASQGEIPPGGKGEIRVTYNSKTTTGDQSKSVEVFTNAPDSITTVVVKAKVKRDVNLPNSIQFGQVTRGQPAEQVTTVSAEPGLDYKIVKVEGDAPFIKAKFEPAASKAGEGATYKVTVSLTADAPVGPVNNRLRIFSNLDKKPVVEVPLYATVMGDLKVSSNSVNFGTFKPGTAQEVILTIEAPATHPIHVTSVRTSTPEVVATLKTVKDGHAYEVHCSVSAAKQSGRIAGKLIIETSDPAEARRELQLIGFVKS